MSIENVIDIKRFNSLQKLLRITSWVKRFVNSLKKKVLEKKILKKPFVDSNELHNGFQKIKAVLIKKKFK